MIPIYKSDNEIEANVLLSLLRAKDIPCKLGKFRQGIKVGNSKFFINNY